MKPQAPHPGAAIELRAFRQRDALQVNKLALAAFEQYRDEYGNWPAMAASVSSMSALASSGDITVAERDGRIVGAVAYVPSGWPKASFFDASWPVLRMLVVDPAARGGGIGRALTLACLERARRDGAELIALHTSPIMQVALAMYLRLGFERLHDTPPIHGVPYAVYVKRLG
jgi:ribosomal protein S18 acetylase RimI-like enzyme